MYRVLSTFLILLSAITLYAQDETSDSLIAAVTAASEPEVIQNFESDNQLYSARVTVYPCVDIEDQEMSYEHLDVTDASTGETHMVAEQLINCGGLGAAGLSIIRWSPNGEFLYYTDAREGTPDGLVTGWAPPVWRLQLADLQVNELGKARFSFDGQWLLTWNNTQVSVLSTNASDATEYALLPANLTIIDVMWLPDLSGILYIQADAAIAGSRSAVTHIDLETMEQTVLLDTAE